MKDRDFLSQHVELPPGINFSGGAIERATRALEVVPPPVVEETLWSAVNASLTKRNEGRKVGPFGPGRLAFEQLEQEVATAKRKALSEEWPQSVKG